MLEQHQIDQFLSISIVLLLFFFSFLFFFLFLFIFSFFHLHLHIHQHRHSILHHLHLHHIIHNNPLLRIYYETLSYSNSLLVQLSLPVYFSKTIISLLFISPINPFFLISSICICCCRCCFRCHFHHSSSSLSFQGSYFVLLQFACLFL